MMVFTAIVSGQGHPRGMTLATRRHAWPSFISSNSVKRNETLQTPLIKLKNVKTSKLQNFETSTVPWVASEEACVSNDFIPMVEM
jgi:hypothetical protein